MPHSPLLSPIEEPAVENTGLSMGLSLRVLFVAAVLIATVVITILILICVFRSQERKEQFLQIHMKSLEMHMDPHNYPTLPDTIATDVN